MHYKNNASEDEIREFTNYRVSKTYRMYLPHDSSVLNEPVNLVRLIKNQIIRIFAFRQRLKLDNIIKNGKYDCVILNSVTLYRMVREDYPFVVYIREVVKSDGFLNNRVIRKLNKCSKVIFISKVIFHIVKA